MNEPEFIEGSSLNTFGENLNYEGKEFRSKQKYKIFGTTLDKVIDEKYLCANILKLTLMVLNI